MTLLYLAASYLFAVKMIDDLDAFTPESKRRVDLFAFLLIAIILILFAFALARPLQPLQTPCELCPV